MMVVPIARKYPHEDQGKKKEFDPSIKTEKEVENWHDGAYTGPYSCALYLCDCPGATTSGRLD